VLRRITALTILGLVVGAVVGVLAVVFVDTVLWLFEKLHNPDLNQLIGVNRSWASVLTIAVPAAGGLLVGLIRRVLPEQRFDSLQDAIHTTMVPGSYMPMRHGLASTLAAWLSLGSGASVGQYGPLAHMGAYLGCWASRLHRTDASLRPIGIACGVAAAISAAFHAPLAGLVFAREVVLRHYSLRAFAPIAVASTVAYVVDHVIFGRAPLFQIEQHIVASPQEYLVFIIIGVAGALIATTYMWAIDYASKVAEKLRWPGPLKTTVAGVALGLVALQVPEVLGIGQEVLRHAMAGDLYDAADLCLILVAKLLMTAICLGFGFAGGVFSPALLIGTLFGALIGTGAGWLLGGEVSHIAVYAVCGLVAVTSPVIGAPLTTVLIVFELTQNFDLATAAWISVAFANLIGYRIYGRSIFDKQLLARGFDLSMGRDKVMVQRHKVSELLDSDFTKHLDSDSLAEVRDALTADGRSEAYIVDASGNYIGTLTVQRLLGLLAGGVPVGRPARDYATPESLVLHRDSSIWHAMNAMQGFVGESIPVVDNGILVGVVSEAAIVSAYLEIVQDVRREEHAAF